MSDFSREQAQLDSLAATLREALDLLADQGARRLLVLEALRQVMPVYSTWASQDAVDASAVEQAFAALERAGAEAVPPKELKPLLKALSLANKAASKATGYDRKTRRDAVPAARAAAYVCHALDGALHRYVGQETVTLGFVDSAWRAAGASNAALEQELTRSIERARALNPVDDHGWQDAFAELTAQRVPAEGEAPTVHGEILRCLGNLADEAHRNGNVNFGERHRRMLAFLEGALPEGRPPLERAAIERALRSIGDDPQALDTTSHRVLARYAVRRCRAEADRPR